MTFKKDVPSDRTIVPGVWIDIQDDWSNSFVNDGDKTSQGVSITNPSVLEISSEIRALQNSNEQMVILLQAILAGIEIIANQGQGDLLDFTE